MAQVCLEGQNIDENNRVLPRSRTGYIDRDGNQVVPPIYIAGDNYAEGLAAVNTTDYEKPLWGYIDRTGKMAIRPQFKYASAFSNGLAAVCVQDSDGAKWGFIDKTGAMIIAPRFASAGDFSGGLAPASVESPYFRLNADDYRRNPAKQ